MERRLKTGLIVDNLTDEEFARVFDREYVRSLVLHHVQQTESPNVSDPLSTLNQRISTLELSEAGQRAHDLSNSGERSDIFRCESILELPVTIIGKIGTSLNMMELARLEPVHRYLFTAIREMAPLQKMTASESRKVVTFWKKNGRKMVEKTVWNRFRNVWDIEVSIESIFNVDVRGVYMLPLNWKNIIRLTISGYWHRSRCIAKQLQLFRGKLDNVIELNWDLWGFPVYYLFPFLSSLRFLRLLESAMMHHWPESAFLASPPSLRSLIMVDEALRLNARSGGFLSHLGSLHFDSTEGEVMRAHHMMNIEELCFNPERSSFAMDLMVKSGWPKLKIVNLHGITKMRPALEGVIAAMISAPKLRCISIVLLPFVHPIWRYGIDTRSRNTLSLFSVCRDALQKRDGPPIVMTFVCDGLIGWNKYEYNKFKVEMVKTVRILKSLEKGFVIGWKFRAKDHLMGTFNDVMFRFIKEMGLSVHWKLWKDGTLRSFYVSRGRNSNVPQVLGVRFSKRCSSCQH